MTTYPEIPYGYGGLGNKGDKKEEVVEIKVKKKAKQDRLVTSDVLLMSSGVLW